VSAEGRLIKGGPSLWERVRVRAFSSSFILQEVLLPAHGIELIVSERPGGT
jgi:hypothetical protein